MSATKTFRYADYELQCSARAVDSGKFAPALVVARNAWPSRPRVIAMQPGNFLTEETAINAAFNQGVEWIRVFGQR